MTMIHVTIYRTDGTVEHVQVNKVRALRELAERHMNYEYFDTVNLRDGNVMLCDDDGQHKDPRPPVNAWATAAYLALCVPGTVYELVGDVAVLRDADLE